MTTTHSVQVAPPDVNPDALGYFRFGKFGDGWILTNEFGEWHHLDDGAFRTMLQGTTDLETTEGEALMAKGFLREGLQLDHVSQAMRRRKKHVGLGPSRHVIPLTVDGTALTVETAKEILDFVMLSTSSVLELQLEGEGAPDLDLLGFLVQYGTEKNRYEGKNITWRLLADPADIDDDAAAWLVDKRFAVRTTVDTLPIGEATAAGIARLQSAATARKRDAWSVEADLPATAANAGTLWDRASAALDLGLTSLRVVPATGDDAPAVDAWKTAYAAYVDALVAAGKVGQDAFTAGLVRRIVQTDPDDGPEGRSPAGGVLAYDLAGHIYPGPLARDADDPEMFLLGTCGETAYKDATTHPTLRALAMASLLECLPGFADHWATPYLGIDPTLAWATTGDLFHQGLGGADVTLQIAALEVVFGVLVDGDEAAIEALTAVGR